MRLPGLREFGEDQALLCEDGTADHPDIFGLAHEVGIRLVNLRKDELSHLVVVQAPTGYVGSLVRIDNVSPGLLAIGRLPVHDGQTVDGNDEERSSRAVIDEPQFVLLAHPPLDKVLPIVLILAHASAMHEHLDLVVSLPQGSHSFLRDFCLHDTGLRPSLEATLGLIRPTDPSKLGINLY